MFKKLAKKQLLGILTAAAIVVTTVGSFAVWDTLSASKNASLTLDKPVTVTAGAEDVTFTAGTRTLETANTYTADNLKFDVSMGTGVVSNPQLALETKVTIDGDSTETDVADAFTITLKKADAELAGGIDKTVTEGENAYTVVLTPNAQDSNPNYTKVLEAATAGKTLSVEVTGTLSAASGV